MNIISYFVGGCDNPVNYEVRITADPGDSAYTEVKMGSSPFVLTYEESATPFEPSRISTASIGIFFGDEIYDIFSPYAQGTKVELIDTDNDIVEWVGYLKPNLYNQQLMYCEDDITLEASDCLASLQYMDYQVHNQNQKRIVTFKNILDDIVNAAGLSGYWISDTKSIFGTVMSTSLSLLKISEKNFFSSDIDKPWTYAEVLDEICRYLGYTAVQYKDSLYLVDYAYFGSHDSMPGKYFTAPDFYVGESLTINSGETITQEHLRGAGTSLSFNTLYNKVYVRDSIYKTDDYIPDIFKDDYLTNRYGDMSEYRQIPLVQSVKMLPGSGAQNPYAPLYIGKNGKQKTDADDEKYLFFRKMYDNEYYNSIYRDDSGNTVTLTEEQLASSAATRTHIGATLVDFMAEENDTESLNYEPQATPSWTRYLMISQKDYPGGNLLMSPSNGSASLPYFPSVYELKSGYTCPVIIDGEKSFLVLSCSALWERYTWHDYINPKWVNEAQLGTKELYSGYITCIPKLFFLLKIGDYYWDGNQWTTTESGFAPDVERSLSDKNKSDFNNWNKELHVLNRVEWEEMSGEDGYKIPLDDRLDMSAEIKFEVRLPGRITNYWGPPGRSLWLYDGVNNYVWIKDLAVKLTTEGASNSESDVLYENELEINNNSLNELQDITFKITTFPGDGALSYSHVGYSNRFLQTVDDYSLAGRAQNPEMNCIERWVSQFSTGTKKMQFKTDLSFNILQKLSEGIYDENYVPVGARIDYGEGSQDITIMQIKNLAAGDAGSIISVKRVDSGNIAFTGGTAQIRVISSHPWTVTADTSYGTLSASGGTGGGVSNTIYYTFNRNYTTSSRSTKLIFTDSENGTTQELIIVQSKQNNSIKVYRFDTEEQTAMYTISDFITLPDGSEGLWVQVMDDTMEWNMPTYTADWITVTRHPSLSNVFHITMTANETNQQRMDTLNFYNSNDGLWVLNMGQSAANAIVLTVVQPDGYVSWEGGTITVQVESLYPWTASTEYTAMGSFLTYTGNGGSIEEFNFVMGQNDSAGTRQIYFTVNNSQGGSARTVYFTQEGVNSPYAYFSYYDSWYTEYTTCRPRFELSGGTQTVYLHSNTNWIIPGSYMDGITYSPLTGSTGVTPITITCASTSAGRAMSVLAYDIQAQGTPIARSNYLFIDQAFE